MYVRLPADLVNTLDTFLKKRGLSRNESIAAAAFEKLRREMQAEKLKDTRGALSAEDVPA